jgi:hypothetical protein
MSAPPAASPATAAACTHCATPLAGRFCHACGQDALPAETALASWREQWRRLLRTLHALILRPGLLTQEHLSGARIRYIPPLTLFLNVVAVFFLFSVATEFRVQSFVRNDSSHYLDRVLEKRAQAAGISKELFLERVERRFQGVYTVCLASISLLGYTLLMKLMFLRHWRDWRGPFTFALHYLAFVFIALPALMIAVHSLSGLVGKQVLQFAAMIASAVGVVTWLALASRRLFAERWAVAIAKGVAVLVLGFFIDQAMFITAVFVTFNLA